MFLDSGDEPLEVADRVPRASARGDIHLLAEHLRAQP